IKEYLSNSIIPQRIQNRIDRRNFINLAKKFLVKNGDANNIYFKKSETLLLRFFAIEEDQSKFEYINMIHVENGHPGRHRLMGFLKNKLYNYSRSEIENVLRQCPQCVARNLMNTRPPITPIRAYFIRERYCFDLVDLRRYNEINDEFNWLLVGLDSFSKFAWTFALKSKNSNEVVSAIKKVILTFGQPFIIHTDNGREFCNNNMNAICEKYNIRHVRGRARCPWVQGQVERLNQTLKFSISSTCFSLNIPGRWTRVYEEVTYSYNCFLHETTRHSPFELMFGRSVDDCLERHYSIEDLNNYISHIEQLNSLYNDDIDENFIYNAWNINEIDNIRSRAIYNSDIAGERMVERSMWPNDTIPMIIGQKVIRRVHLDNNRTTRRMALYDHLDSTVYTIISFNNIGNATIRSDDDQNIIITNVLTRDLSPIN
ncbi:KRAB-A domain-containing protein 2, partial [Dictyocoela muelleri]